MPRRKKSTSNRHKPQLSFLENPLQGPVHHYGSPLQKAENPRYVPAKPLDQSTSTAWVSPQFDHTIDLQFPGRRRRLISNSTLKLPSRTHNATRSLFNTSKASRKPTVCRFPSLDFKDFSSVHSDLADSHLDVWPVRHAKKHGFCNTGTNHESGLVQRGSPMCPLIHASPISSFHEDVTADCDTPSLPDVDTPEPSPVSRHSSIQIRRLSLPPRVTSEESSPARTFKEIMGLCHDSKDLDSSSEATDGLTIFPVLVQDTPEHEYGMRITWRRRRELMKYLRDRGKLKSSDIVVKGGLSSNINSNNCFDFD